MLVSVQRLSHSMCPLSAWRVQPRNYLLFACHFINEGSQLTQAYRFMDWHKWGGREKAISSGELVLDKAKEGIKEGAQKVEAAVSK